MVPGARSTWRPASRSRPKASRTGARVDQAPVVEVIRSSGRVKTASARWDERHQKMIVRLPAGLPPVEEQQLIDKLVAKMQAGARRRDLNNEGKLPQRAAELNREY